MVVKWRFELLVGSEEEGIKYMEEKTDRSYRKWDSKAQSRPGQRYRCRAKKCSAAFVFLHEFADQKELWVAPKEHNCEKKVPKPPKRSYKRYPDEVREQVERLAQEGWTFQAIWNECGSKLESRRDLSYILRYTKSKQRIRIAKVHSGLSQEELGMGEGEQMSPPAVDDISRPTMAPDQHQDLILDTESNKENHQPLSQNLIPTHPRADQDYTFRNSFPSKASALHSMGADGEWESRRTDLLSVGQAFQYHFRCKRNNPFRMCWAQFYILHPHWQDDVVFVFTFNAPHTCDWTPAEKLVGKRVRIPKEVKAEIKRLVQENWSPMRIWTEYGQKVLENKRQLVYCLKLALAPQTEDETEDSIVISDGEDNGMDIDLEESIQKTVLKKEQSN